MERGELQDAADLAFENKRQDENAARWGVAKTGGNADVFARHVGQLNLFFFECALTDEAFAQVKSSSMLIFRSLGGVTGEQFKLRFFRGGIEDVKFCLAGVDH